MSKASTLVRLLMSAAFGILGFASLWFWATADARLCTRFPSLCVPRAGACTEIDHCAMSTPREIGIAAIYLGPGLIFMIAAFAFAGRRRSTLAWAGLLVALVLLHGVAMLAVRLSAL